MADQQVRRYPTPSAIREMQMRATGYHGTTTTIFLAKIRPTASHAREDGRDSERSCLRPCHRGATALGEDTAVLYKPVQMLCDLWPIALPLWASASPPVKNKCLSLLTMATVRIQSRQVRHSSWHTSSKCQLWCCCQRFSSRASPPALLLPGPRPRAAALT